MPEQWQLFLIEMDTEVAHYYEITSRKKEVIDLCRSLSGFKNTLYCAI